MYEGYSELESSHPPIVVERVNEIADILNTVGGFRFYIDQRGLDSVIVIEKGALSEDVINAIILHTQRDALTLTTLDESHKEITVSLKNLN